MMRCIKRKYLLLLCAGLMLALYYVIAPRHPSKPKAAGVHQRLLAGVIHDVTGFDTSSHDVINTTCQFPLLNPFDPDVVKYLITYKTLNCSSGIPSLVYVEGDFLRVNKTKVEQLQLSYDYCIYTPLIMKKGSEYSFLPPRWSKPFHHSIHLSNKDEYLYIWCDYRTVPVSISFTARFIRKKKTERRSRVAYKKHLEQNSPSETFNILMIGVDGLSKQAFARSMPKTRNFLLKRLQAKEMHIFNKLGDNTFPNVMPMLTNLHKEELLQKWSYDEPLDKINHLFIWDKYQKAGYRTALMTDVSSITAFHYMKEGWDKPPFDYYYRPIPVMTDPTDPEVNHVIRNTSEHCIGDVPEVSLLLDYWLQMTSVLNDSRVGQRFRSFFTRLSHDYSMHASLGDELYRSFFDQLYQRNLLHNTVLIVFSDHGGRFGYVRATYNGMLESRMPFMFFVFPSWFKDKYPKVMATFETNQRRLTTMFDVHATLKELLYFRGGTGKVDLTQRGISLFREIPTTRNCDQAGIPLKYCLCSGLHRSNVSHTLSDILTDRLQQHILTSIEMHRNICAFLSVKSVMSIYPMFTGLKSRSVYQTTIATSPGGAIFEASLSYDPKTHKAQVEGDVVRVNRYSGQDECMRNLELKKYCYCKHN